MGNAIPRNRRVRNETGKTTYLPYLALFATVLFWGASFPASRVAVRLLDPQAVMFCRMVIACLIMAPFLRRLFPCCVVIHRSDLKLLLPMVLLQPCLYFFLEANALKLTTSSQAGIISASVPVLVALGAWLFLAEKIKRSVFTGLLLSMAGVAVLTLCGRGGVPGDNPVLGNSLEFAAMACAAGNMLLVKILSRKYNPWVLTAMQFWAGLVFFSPGIRHVLAAPEVLRRPDLISALVLLGVFASVGAFGLYNWAMSRLPASRASVFINLVPAVAVLLGWTLLGESLSLGQAAGALIVGTGVLISQKGR